MIAYGFSEYGGPETEYFLDVPIPDPGQGQVLVAVHAAGVNPADWKVRAGTRKDTVQTILPAVLGREVSGTVVQVGTHVDGFSVGDHVFGSTAAGHGAYAQYTVLNASSTARKPEAVSFAVAATLPVAAGTAFDAVDQLNLSPGSTLLVLGAGGGVGSVALQIAATRGLKTVGVASEQKREWVAGLGARFVASGEHFADAVDTVVDGIFDLVGGETLRSAVSLIKPDAPVVSVADSMLAASLGGSGVTRRRTTETYEAVAELVASGTLRPRVEKVFPLERAGDALAAVETGHTLGKVVIEVG
ncbi:NADP-dependent oxidoreductase [Rhodococcoides fascians]|uniref:NADP-dependent oxidoreductase n=1 Tax=Rhodococcoides fascians TaxID=1828 RepID=UPI00055A62AA|nr:NADP-dependent oxidoreductase [Rhodococcus fascians]